MPDALATLIERAEHERQESDRRTSVLRMLDKLRQNIEDLGYSVTAEQDEGDIVVCIGLSWTPAEHQASADTEVAPVESAFENARGVLRTEADPEPVAPPEPAETHGSAWTEDEDAKAVQMRAERWTVRQIAEALGRSEAATTFRLSKKLKERIEAARQEIERENFKRPDAEGASSGTEADTPPVSLSARREVRANLDRAGNPDGWPIENDIALVEGLAQGKKCWAVAHDLGVSKAEAVARFRVLCPEPGIEAQALLLEELKARAAATEAAQ